MRAIHDLQSIGCTQCRNLSALEFAITMAFQPIVDVAAGRVFGYEALVRGTNGEGAGEVLSRVNDDNRYRFDQSCRVCAIETASRLGLDSRLSINFLPNAVYRPETCIRATLEAARTFDFPSNNIMFEVTESEPVRDPNHLSAIFDEYRNQGFITAIDDFGAGHAGLSLLVDFQPDVIKLDMHLVRNIHQDRKRLAVVRGTVATAIELGVQVIAEGIEHQAEYEALHELGVTLFQGYLFARPEVEALPDPRLP
jgi:EAL domain-containing protein (putative c-di-GMP-specific phosphodiesterase class I)